jgi:hypothetical protein
LNLAAHRLQYLMKLRRSVLSQSQPAGKPVDARSQQHRQRTVAGYQVEVDPTS